jgi:hypothetical protein
MDKMAVEQSFFAKGYELALVLDPDQLIDPMFLKELAATNDPLQNSFNFSSESDESKAMGQKLGSALWVGTLPDAEYRYTSRWPFAPAAFERQSTVYHVGGCQSRDTTWDTAIYEGFYDTGEPVEPLESGRESAVESVVESSVVESVGYDSHVYPINPSCGCLGSGGESQESTAESGSESANNGDSGEESGCACGDGDSADSWAGLLFSWLWYKRRREAEAAKRRALKQRPQRGSRYGIP